MPEGGRLVAFTGCRVDMGQTWIAIALATLLGEAGRRCLLIDTTGGFDTACDQLDLTPPFIRLPEQEDLPPDDMIVPACGGAGSGGFDLLQAPVVPAFTSEPSEPARLSRIAASLRKIAGAYDVTLLDLESGIFAATMEVAGIADTVFVVSRDDPSDLTGTYAYLKVLNQIAPDTPVQVLVNRTTDRPRGEQAHAQLVRACDQYFGLRPPLAGVLTGDAGVPAAQKAKTPYPVLFPDSETTAELRRIVHEQLA